VEGFNLEHAALTVYCVDCEYDLILNDASDEALKTFDQIIME